MNSFFVRGKYLGGLENIQLLQSDLGYTADCYVGCEAY